MKGRIQVRMLGRGDVDVLARAADGVFDHQVQVAGAAAFLEDPRHHIAVALDDGVVVGFASGVHYIHPDKPVPELWINEVAVAPSHRGRGLGRQVVTALCDAARRLGCAEAWVLTNRANEVAMRLYASAGGVASTNDEVMFSFTLSAGPTRDVR